jgi:hypothetical protein
MQTTRFSVGKWLILVPVLVLAAACSAQRPDPSSPQAPQPAGAPAVLGIGRGTAQLIVVPSPDGVQVMVDGEVRGASPLTLTLPAGEHRIALSAAGFAPFSETIALEGGREATYAPELEDIEPPVARIAVDVFQAPWEGQTRLRAFANDNTGVLDIELALDDQTLAAQTLAAIEGGELSLDFTPAELPGIQPGRTYTLTVIATDAAGNQGVAQLPLPIGPRLPLTATAAMTSTVGQQPASPPPTSSPSAERTAAPAVLSPTAPTPEAAPRPAAAATATARPAPVSFRVSQVTIPTYPYPPFLQPAVAPALGADPASDGYPVLVLDRSAYEASNPKPVPITYTLLILENRFLRLTLLPELGGRIYEVVFKPTGNNQLYRNPVIKPTAWGPANPPGANWWPAAGGIEWGFPVEEHGYEWGREWGYDSVRLPDGGVMVSLLMQDPARPYATVNVTLSPEAAFFVVEPTVANPTDAPARIKWWSNAMLAPGAANQAGPDLRFIFPVNEVTVHSSGDAKLPAAGQPMSWPVYGDRDLSRLGNWGAYLGFFERPAAQGAAGPNGPEGFMGVYDTAAGEGMLRIYPSDVARGAKGFAPGWSQPIPSSAWTDDGSGYVELHGGLMPTFDEWLELPPAAQVSWQETWYPVAGINGVTHATAAAALHLSIEPTALRVSLFPTTPVQGEIRVALPGAAPIAKAVTISPAEPFSAAIPLPADAAAPTEVTVTLVNAQGQTIYAYRGPIGVK